MSKKLIILSLVSILVLTNQGNAQTKTENIYPKQDVYIHVDGRKTTLHDLMSRLKQVYDVEILYVGGVSPSAKNLRFDCGLRTSNFTLQKILEYIQIPDYKFKIVKKIVYVSKKL